MHSKPQPTNTLRDLPQHAAHIPKRIPRFPILDPKHRQPPHAPGNPQYPPCNIHIRQHRIDIKHLQPRPLAQETLDVRAYLHRQHRSVLRVLERCEVRHYVRSTGEDAEDPMGVGF